MVQLLIATNNQGKKCEFAELLAALPLTLVSGPDVGVHLDVEETGQTYLENARLKALAYHRATGLLTLADDSGLEVDALNGAPGVRSARYAGGTASDIDRYELLLERLQGVPMEQRTARFCCAVVVLTPEGNEYQTEGVCEGVIALEPHGESGFGYDPVFLVPRYGMTFSEMPTELKNRISHRGVAVAKMIPILTELIGKQE